MRFPTREQVERVKAEFPPGTKVELVRMRDIKAPRPGTIGEVMFVDDTASIHTKWSTGSTLAIIYGEDICRKIK